MCTVDKVSKWLYKLNELSLAILPSMMTHYIIFDFYELFIIVVRLFQQGTEASALHVVPETVQECRRTQRPHATTWRVLQEGNFITTVFFRLALDRGFKRDHNFSISHTEA